MTKKELIEKLSDGGWAMPDVTIEWLMGEFADASFGRLTRDEVEKTVLANGEELVGALLSDDYETVADVLEKCPVLKGALGFDCDMPEEFSTPPCSL